MRKERNKRKSECQENETNGPWANWNLQPQEKGGWWQGHNSIHRSQSKKTDLSWFGSILKLENTAIHRNPIYVTKKKANCVVVDNW